jgi:hypothetical protein
VATYTLDWSETDLGGSAVVSYAAGAVLDFTDKPAGATAALSLTANQGGSANVTIVELEVETSGSSVMTFDYHTSSESGWDKLHIDVDGASQANYSGATAWTTHAGISIASAGTHTIRFRYQKDGSGDTDADRVWVALLNITNTVTVNDASGSDTTYNMEDGAIPSAVTTSDWTNSTSEPIAGTRSLRSPAATAANGSYDLEITQPAAADYTVVAFDWKVSSEFNYDEIYLFPDAAAANVPASGAPSSAGSPGWLDYSDEAAGRLGFIIPPAGRTVLVRYAKDAGTDGGSDAAWIDNLSMPASAGTNYDKTPADAEGITDARTVTQALSRAQGDALGLTDSVTAAVTAARTVGDSLGISDTDSPLQLEVGEAVDDPLGITDSVDASLSGTLDQTPADPVGLTDAVAVAVTIIRDAADALGITDTDAPLELEVEDVTADGVGLTDTLTVVRASAVTVADPVGLTDAAEAAGEGDESATLADTVGATDSTATTFDGIRTPSDTAGIADLVAPVLTGTRSPADSVGATDTVTVVLDRVLTLEDELAMSDVDSWFVGGIVTPASRTYVVPAENRTVVVPAENRTVVVPA